MATNQLSKRPATTLRCGNIKATIWQDVSERAVLRNDLFPTVQGSVRRGHARIFDGRAWGLILNEVFGTFLARPKGFLSFLFLPGG